MKILLDGLSIIALGGWNPQIFSPDWIKNNICDDKQSQVDFAVQVNNPIALPRLGFDGVYLFVDPMRLEIKPQDSQIESFSKCLKYLKKILEILKHTPVISFGINFAFVNDGDKDDIMQNFILKDIACFDAEENKLKTTIIQRAFEQKDKSVMNLYITKGDDKEIISFNYHRDVKNADECVQELADDIIEKYQKKCLSILQDVYKVQVECE
jgi:hypothetical protein